jgi:hypothetical protein
MDHFGVVNVRATQLLFMEPIRDEENPCTSGQLAKIIPLYVRTYVPTLSAAGTSSKQGYENIHKSNDNLPFYPNSRHLTIRRRLVVMVRPHNSSVWAAIRNTLLLPRFTVLRAFFATWLKLELTSLAAGMYIYPNFITREL